MTAKKILPLLTAISMFLGLTAVAQAELFNRGTDTLGNRLIYDNDLNITWYDYWGPLADGWYNQMNWASALTVSFGGNIYNDWRLPTTVDGPDVFGYDGTTTSGYNITSSELGHLFYTELGNKGYYDTSGNYQLGGGVANKGPFLYLQNNAYWSSTTFYYYGGNYYNDANTGNAWIFSFYYGNQGVSQKSYPIGLALAVRPGDVAAVPEPASLLLLGTGLVGIVALKRKKH